MSDYRNQGPADRMQETVQNPAEMGSTRVAFPKMGTVVNAPYVKVRKEPSPDAETITSKLCGDRVKVLSEAEDYYKINAYGEAIGYMKKEYVKLDR